MAYEGVAPARRMGTILLALTTVTAVIALSGTSAHAAGWSFRDAITSTTVSAWSEDGGGDWDVETISSGMGDSNAFRLATFDENSWAAVGRRVFIAPALTRSMLCYADVYLQRRGIGPTVPVNFEVINAATMGYYKLATFSIPTSAGGLWLKYTVGPWVTTSASWDPLIRVATGSPTNGELTRVDVDELTVRCAPLL